MARFIRGVPTTKLEKWAKSPTFQNDGDVARELRRRRKRREIARKVMHSGGSL